MCGVFWFKPSRLSDNWTMQNEAATTSAAAVRKQLLDKTLLSLGIQGRYLLELSKNLSSRPLIKEAAVMVKIINVDAFEPKDYNVLFLELTENLKAFELFTRKTIASGDLATDIQTAIKIFYTLTEKVTEVFPRLYLMIVVAGVYVQQFPRKARKLPAELCEACSAVQHPLKALFLRSYLTSVLNDALCSAAKADPKVASAHVQFLVKNFTAMLRAWARLGTVDGRRPKPRARKWQMSTQVLVSSVLFMMSRVEGLTPQLFASSVISELLRAVLALPSVAQQKYFMTAIVQLFDSRLLAMAVPELFDAIPRLHKGFDTTRFITTLFGRFQAILGNATAHERASELIRKRFEAVPVLQRRDACEHETTSALYQTLLHSLCAAIRSEQMEADLQTSFKLARLVEEMVLGAWRGAALLAALEDLYRALLDAFEKLGVTGCATVGESKAAVQFLVLPFGNGAENVDTTSLVILREFQNLKLLLPSQYRAEVSLATFSAAIFNSTHIASGEAFRTLLSEARECVSGFEGLDRFDKEDFVGAYAYLFSIIALPPPQTLVALRETFAALDGCSDEFRVKFARAYIFALLKILVRKPSPEMQRDILEHILQVFTSDLAAGATWIFMTGNASAHMFAQYATSDELGRGFTDGACRILTILLEAVCERVPSGTSEIGCDVALLLRTCIACLSAAPGLFTDEITRIMNKCLDFPPKTLLGNARAYFYLSALLEKLAFIPRVLAAGLTAVDMLEAPMQCEAAVELLLDFLEVNVEFEERLTRVDGVDAPLSALLKRRPAASDAPGRARLRLLEQLTHKQ
eukprot:gnl/Chilomastix_cuspidata/1641.p1 GENE.gnl/Chilomastix_cuspidata/1641~~gnl/Chilomastix_cuspidata/1641.p1  ORF type:complete len:807 (+),score=151.37 gnl/Chilomastix_cuspidata/1641:691-3111(+)